MYIIRYIHASCLQIPPSYKPSAPSGVASSPRHLSRSPWRSPKLVELLPDPRNCRAPVVGPNGWDSMGSNGTELAKSLQAYRYLR